ncbi:MAG TPA: NADPH:quinone oxidoreductase family protein [Acidimicrobiales bacterium]|jgi:NADPH2:quinone reductase|nr:NADPH:quinone oxidoreductase family protein [Acidimicrobiales bacterium]
MRAVLCKEFGPPESLVVEDIDPPEAGPGQVVIDVHACAVNFPDVLIIQNLYQFKPPLPFSPGAEVAGVVRAAADDVEGVRVGDRVFASPGWGGLAEQVAVAATSCVRVPEGIDLVPASAFLYAYGTSHHALKDRAALQAGETLLVLGAAGGVGLAAVELGAQMGAAVIAAASTDEKLALCRERGAAMTINYSTEDLKTRVRELTDGRGVDIVYDAVGGPYSEPALRSTAWDGRYLVVGFAAGEIPRIPLNLPLLKQCSIVGVFWGAFVGREPERHRRNVEELLELWRSGAIRPHVSATYPLERAGEAIRELADRKAQGKVVVTVV